MAIPIKRRRTLRPLFILVNFSRIHREQGKQITLPILYVCLPIWRGVFFGRQCKITKISGDTQIFRCVEKHVVYVRKIYILQIQVMRVRGYVRVCAYLNNAKFFVEERFFISENFFSGVERSRFRCCRDGLYFSRCNLA